LPHLRPLAGRNEARSSAEENGALFLFLSNKNHQHSEGMQAMKKIAFSVAVAICALTLAGQAHAKTRYPDDQGTTKGYRPNTEVPCKGQDMSAYPDSQGECHVYRKGKGSYNVGGYPD
jgi:hypothetical protein